MFPALIEKLIRREDLTSDEASAAMAEVMAGRASEAHLAAFLVGLAMKGERPVEIVGLARARATSASLPSTPSTSRARVASGSVKLPSPQNQSITRSLGCTSSRRSARETSTWLMCGLTWVKSVGLKGMTTPNSGSA